MDSWFQANPGIRVLHRVQRAPAQQIHAVVIDLREPGVQIAATERSKRWSSVSEFAEEGEFAVAINGGFWDRRGKPVGLAVGQTPWTEAFDDDHIGFFAMRGGRAWISPPEATVTRLRGMHATVSGRPMLLRRGEVDGAALAEAQRARFRDPRTAVGVSKDGRRVFFVVADGRQERARGLTLYELAELFDELGAHHALNLDGGGSSTLFIKALGGVINVPSGSRLRQRLGLGPTPDRDGKVRGIERAVLNHLGVRARPLPESVTPSPSSLPSPGAPPPLAVGKPLPPILRIGVLREWLDPWTLGLAVCGVCLVAFLRRHQRRRRLRTAVRSFVRARESTA